MMVTLSGDRTHFIPGQEVEFEDKEAQRLVDAHFAKFVGDSFTKTDELAELKAKADELGIKYTKKTTLEELTKLIEEAENK